MKHLTILIISSILAISTNASSYVPLSNVELVHYADIVVKSSILEKDGATFLKVEQVLKGKKSSLIKLKGKKHLSLYFTKNNNRGFFFLKKDSKSNQYYLFHPSCCQSLNQFKNVSKAVNIWKAPKKYLNLNKYSSDQGVNFLLGELFNTWNISCEAAPWFFQKIEAFDPLFKILHWDEKMRIKFTVNISTDVECTIVSTHPERKLSILFKRQLIRAIRSHLNGFDTQHTLPNEFSIVLDNRNVDQAKKISRKKAVHYLNTSLKSPELDIVRSSIFALAKLGELQSVSKVLPLIYDTDKVIATTAIRFLGWSKSKNVIDEIGLLLINESKKYPKEFRIASTCALALECIHQESCIPFLETAALHGVERAIYALKKIGRTESFEVFIQALEVNPEKTYPAVNALFWFVKRSNKKVEHWMPMPSSYTKTMMIEKIPLWKKWWDDNKTDVKIIIPFSAIINQKCN